MRVPTMILAGLACLLPQQPAHAQSNLTAVWANDGGDKVAQGELRAVSDPGDLLNSIWDGTTVTLFAARNEVVSFNLVLEASGASANNVTVAFDRLEGPDGANIQSTAASGDEVFKWVDRPIELFYVRYLEIKGLSTDLFFAGYNYDERHVPERMRRPWSGPGDGVGTWEDRPDHNAFYPDIAVPLELENGFTIDSGTNQSIWVDVYVPHATPAGRFTGTVIVTEGGTTMHEIPVELTVRDFMLPDEPSAKTMLFLGYEDLNTRYLGVEYPNEGTSEDDASRLIRDRHFQLAHRHRISLIDANERSFDWNQDGEPLDRPHPQWLPRLDGSLFTASEGYDGFGVGVGNGVYSIGTYGSWPWQGGGESAMREHTDGWVTWFEANAPNTEYFLYLIDESDDHAQIQEWATWIENNPGAGRELPSMATMALPEAEANTPALDIPTSWFNVGETAAWQNAVSSHKADPDNRVWFYNSNRPASGSFATEDDGVALRELAWGQYKMGIDRWFYWESTYYNNFQGNTGQTNVFETAHTFGDFDLTDDVLGQSGGNYLNGDGVLMYPGTDRFYPENSYGVNGPFASLRLKHWRRGIQDVDYLTMAAAIEPDRVRDIVDAMIPTVLWEVGVEDPNDPTWVLADISWPTDPDVWEAARAELADIIESGTSTASEDAASMPAPDFSVEVFPNPFSSQSTIGFSLPTPSHVEIVLFDLAGRRVLTVSDGLQPAGRHEFRFDGSALPSGSYLARVEAGSNIQNKLLQLVK